MITEKEFQEALIIVNEYISQLNSKIEEKQTTLSNFNKTTIIDWIANEERKLGGKKDRNKTRLFNVLRAIYSSDYSDKLEFIEDVKKVNLSRYRNSSDKIHNLFHDMLSQADA
jgi:septal ring factor EnvC (AmiA/AmiB activator)